jgi:hypothetical protein
LLSRALFKRRWRQIQFIPDDEKLWRALHRLEQIYPKGHPKAELVGKPKPSFFRDRNGLSCDLARFSTEQQSRLGYGDEPYPVGAGLVEFTASQFRKVQSDVGHKPVAGPNTRNASPNSLRGPKENYAHVQVTTYLESDQREPLIKGCKVVVTHQLTE